MGSPNIFKRYELKYLISQKDKSIILSAMAPYMSIDQYGRDTIRNLYYDTSSYRLIRRSIEKPAYKEKLRIRSYQKATNQSLVYVELKKKYKHIVYKRRIPLSEHDAMEWLSGSCSKHNTSQIEKEIGYFLHYYKDLHPMVFLSYEREAYYCKDGGDFRVTFDDHIVFRDTELSLKSDVWGTPLLPNDKVLMEIKCSGGIPLWMTKVLSDLKIYKTSFSKYGTAYTNYILPKLLKLKKETSHEHII